MDFFVLIWLRVQSVSRRTPTSVRFSAKLFNNKGKYGLCEVFLRSSFLVQHQRWDSVLFKFFTSFRLYLNWPLVMWTKYNGKWMLWHLKYTSPFFPDKSTSAPRPTPLLVTASPRPPRPPSPHSTTTTLSSRATNPSATPSRTTTLTPSSAWAPWPTRWRTTTRIGRASSRSAITRTTRPCPQRCPRLGRTVAWPTLERQRLCSMFRGYRLKMMTG